MSRMADGGGGSSYKPPPSLGSSLGSAVAGLGNSIFGPSRPAAPRRTSSGSRNIGSSSRPRSSGYSPPAATSYRPPRPPVGSTSRGTVAPSVPQPAPPPMSLDQWLAQDTAYLGQKNAYQKALADYQAQYKAEQGKYQNEYNASLGKLNTEKKTAQTALTDDYASRGLQTSGLYADALNEFQNNYATRQADLERARTAYLSDLSTDSSNFNSQQQLELQRAKDAAAARRAAQLGL